MEEGIFEVLLVSAKGIRHTNLIGKPSYYVLIQCGTEVKKSKTTLGYQHQAFWNEKFKFKLPTSEWPKMTHLQINIMNAKNFKKNGGFVGKTIIFIGGIVAEGIDKGHIELHPSPYNVVLEDTTYKGEIKIGLKFKINKEGCKDRDEQVMQVTRPQHDHLITNLMRCLKTPWWKVFPSYAKSCSENDKRIT